MFYLTENLKFQRSQNGPTLKDIFVSKVGNFFLTPYQLINLFVMCIMCTKNIHENTW